MEVLEHGIGAPMDDKADGVRIDTATEKGNGAACLKAVGITVSQGEAQGDEGTGSILQECHEITAEE